MSNTSVSYEIYRVKRSSSAMKVPRLLQHVYASTFVGFFRCGLVEWLDEVFCAASVSDFDGAVTLAGSPTVP